MMLWRHYLRLTGSRFRANRIEKAQVAVEVALKLFRFKEIAMR